MCAAGICDASKYSELKFLILPFKISQDVQVLSFRNPPACRRVLWILLVRSCTVCFVFVLSRLSPWRGFLPRLTWTHSLPPAIRFVLIFPYDVVGSTLPTPCTTQAWFCTSCCHFDGCFHFFVVFVIGLLRRFLYPMLDPLAFVPNTFYTHNFLVYINIAFSKAVLNMAFSKTLVYTHMLWFKLKPWFEQNQCFCVRVQTIFYTKSCFTQKLCYPRTPCFTQKTMFLLGLFKGYLQPTGSRRNTPKAVK